MKKSLLLIAIGILATFQPIVAQLVYKNGNIRTGSTSASGVAAPSGFFWSEMQAEGTVANTTIGYGMTYNNALTTNNKVADDFTVPPGQSWAISQLSVYAYQTGAAASPSPFDVLRVEIWNGDPSIMGSTVVFGDMTTNRLSSSVDSVTYRTINSITPSPATPGTTRKIWKLNADVSGVTLTAGTYWLVWQLHATNDGGAFAPPCNVVGVRGLPTWNGKQAIGTSWAGVVDAGNPATPPSLPMDFPFEVKYTNPLPVTFVSFTGSKNGSNNLLQWTTATEQNNAGFHIERSVDGTNFSSLEFITSKAVNGNSNSNLSYNFPDSKPLKGDNYYRLKQVDKDGKSAFSNTVLIKSDKSGHLLISSINPNPIKGSARISYNLPKDGFVSIEILNAAGKRISTLVNTQQVAGTYNAVFNSNTVKNIAGTYFYKITVTGKNNEVLLTETKQMVVVE